MTGAEASPEIWLVEIDRLAIPVLLAPLSAALARSAQADLCAEAARSFGKNADTEPGRAIAHLALRLVLARHVGAAKALEPFSRTPLGKPGLSASAAGFSLSHSGERALIAFSPSGEIGCDIEAPRMPRLPDAKRAMILDAAVDIAAGQPLPTMPPEQRFLQAWVRLEAHAKATGEGMGRLLTRYGIFGTDEDRTRLSQAQQAQTHGAGFRVRDLALDRGYAAAIAESPLAPPAPLRVFPVEPAALATFLG